MLVVVVVVVVVSFVMFVDIVGLLFILQCGFVIVAIAAAAGKSSV